MRRRRKRRGGGRGGRRRRRGGERALTMALVPSLYALLLPLFLAILSSPFFKLDIYIIIYGFMDSLS